MRNGSWLVRLRLVIVLILAVSMSSTFVGCGGGDERTVQATPATYLDHALRLMREHTIYAQRVDWPAITKLTHALAAGAQTTTDTYPALEAAIAQLQNAGDLHAAFLRPELARPSGTPAIGTPSVSLLRSGIGYVLLPGISTTPNSAPSKAYAAKLLDGITRAEVYRPCGWIIDLRTDTGGDYSPMLLGVGPILGTGRLIGFTNYPYVTSYSPGRLSATPRTHYTAPTRTADLQPQPPVAVLTNLNTRSSGEAVTVAFKGRPLTRSFGMPTAGYMTYTRSYALSDRATLQLSAGYYVDRRGRVYRNQIKPDVEIAGLGLETSVVQAAERWLQSTEACTAAP
jgi:hypothetical protein